MRRLCEMLTPEESDDIFFPNIPGKKPTRAKALCSQCPFESVCLIESIQIDQEGFWCGTTKQERRVMAALQHIAQAKVDALMPEPDEPTASRPRYLHVITRPDDHKWMDEIEPDDAEIFMLDAAV